LSPKLPQNNPSWKQVGVCKIKAFFGTSNCKILWLTCMFICRPNLTHSFHTICKIIRFKVGKKKNFFSLCSRDIAEFWGPKNPIFIVSMDRGTSNSCSQVSLVHVNKISYPLDVRNYEKIINFHKGVCWNSHTKAIFWQ
jgi:hypothetical protein